MDVGLLAVVDADQKEATLGTRRDEFADDVLTVHRQNLDQGVDGLPVAADRRGGPKESRVGW